MVKISKVEAEISISGRCKHCGKWIQLKDVSNHVAYEHNIYHSNWHKFKAKIRKLWRKIRNGK